MGFLHAVLRRSDELSFGVSGCLWSAQIAEEFKRRKGYDVTPELPALFKDIGPRTPKVRLDYSDVMVALSEEVFFKPVFDWHQQVANTVASPDEVEAELRHLFHVLANG